MATYTIVLTEAEELAMTHAAMDVNGWIQNAIHERARIAIDEVVRIAVNKFLENGRDIPGSKDAIVAAAFANGWIKTANENLAEASKIP
jgi:hypothetical protein